MARCLPRTLRLFLLALSALAGIACVSQIKPPGPPKAFLVYPVEKVRPERLVGSQTTAVVRLAGGEYEAVVLGANGPTAISGLRVTLPLPATPGGDELRLAAYRIEYVPIEHASQWFACTRGLWPDPLVPLQPRAMEETVDGSRVMAWDLERPLDVPVGENRTLLLEIFLPPGNRSDADVDVELLTEAGSARCSIQVRPWGFDLPKAPAFSTAFGFSSSRAIANHRGIAPDDLDADRLVRDYLRLLARFRVSVFSPFEGAVGRLGDDGTLSFDWTGFDNVTGALLDGTLFDDAPPATSFAVPKPPKDLAPARVGEWYRAVEDHLREKGWLERGFASLPDEPMRSEYPEVKASAEAIKAAAPGIRTLVTEPFTRALEGAIDIWCPDLWALGDSILCMPFAVRWPYRFHFDFQRNPDPRVYRDRVARGENAWFYTGLSAFAFDYPNLFIDTRGESQRVIPWLAFRYGITGLLYWQTVSAYSQKGDPWSQPRVMMTNGDGNLLYPGAPGRSDIVSHKPVPSLRLVLLRDGMEDYEYLALLERDGDGKLAGQLARAVAPSSLTWSHDASVLLRMRAAAAERIAAAGKR